MKTIFFANLLFGGLMLACSPNSVPNSRVASHGAAAVRELAPAADDPASAASKTLTTTAGREDAFNPPAVDSYLDLAQHHPTFANLVAVAPPPLIDESQQATVNAAFDGGGIPQSEVDRVSAAQPPAPVYPTAPVAPAVGPVCDYCHGTGICVTPSGWRGKCYTCGGTGHLKAPVAPAAQNKAVYRQSYSSCSGPGCGPGRFRIFGRR